MASDSGECATSRMIYTVVFDYSCPRGKEVDEQLTIPVAKRIIIEKIRPKMKFLLHSVIIDGNMLENATIITVDKLMSTPPGSYSTYHVCFANDEEMFNFVVRFLSHETEISFSKNASKGFPESRLQLLFCIFSGFKNLTFEILDVFKFANRKCSSIVEQRSELKIQPEIPVSRFDTPTSKSDDIKFLDDKLHKLRRRLNFLETSALTQEYRSTFQLFLDAMRLKMDLEKTLE